jgi:hypothetical protein
MEQGVRRAVIGDVALVKHEHAVVEREMAQAVCHGKNDALIAL